MYMYVFFQNMRELPVKTEGEYMRSVYSKQTNRSSLNIWQFSLIKCSDKVYIIADVTIIFISVFPPFPFYFYVQMTANNFILNFHPTKCFLLLSLSLSLSLSQPIQTGP